MTADEVCCFLITVDNLCVGYNMTRLPRVCCTALVVYVYWEPGRGDTAVPFLD